MRLILILSTTGHWYSGTIDHEFKKYYGNLN